MIAGGLDARIVKVGRRSGSFGGQPRKLGMGKMGKEWLLGIQFLDEFPSLSARKVTAIRNFVLALLDKLLVSFATDSIYSTYTKFINMASDLPVLYFAQDSTPTTNCSLILWSDVIIVSSHRSKIYRCPKNYQHRVSLKIVGFQIPSMDFLPKRKINGSAGARLGA